MKGKMFNHVKYMMCSLLFVLALLVVGEGQVVCAEDSNDAVCEEKWDAGVVLEKATLEEDGEVLYTCECCGEKKTEKIPMISNTYLDKDMVVYNQNEQIPSVIAIDANGKELVYNTDYVAECESELINVGRYKIKVTYIGNYYTGQTELDYTIVPKAPESASAKLNDALQIGGHDDIKFSWKKSTGATGYLVYYKKTSDSKWTGPVSTTKLSYVKKNLVDGTKYTFKVVPYYSSSKTKYYDTKEYKTVKVSTKKPGGFITKSGKKYYEYYKGGYADGKYAKSKFLTVDKKTYYFNDKGVMHTGWLKLSGDYYYLNRSNGVQKKNCTVDGIKIKKNGKASETTLNKNKMDLMITARKKMQSITKASDTKKQKLKKVFKWVMDKPYKRYRILPVARKKKGWEVTYANDIFKKGQGCCVSEACAFAFLAKECGYTTVYVADDSEHAWVEINGRVYDTLFAVSKNYNTYYNGTYKKAKLWCHNKKKI